MTQVDEPQKDEQAEKLPEPQKKSRLGAPQLLTLVVLSVFIIWAPKSQNANAYLTTRSVEISSSLPNAVVFHDFAFDALGSPAIGSVVFEYCSNSPLVALPCIAPAGFNSASASLLFQSGDTGYSIHPDTTLSSNRVILTRAVGVSTAGTKQYRIGSVTNPSATNATTYVRISTHSTTDGSGVFDDNGAVAFVTLNPLTVNLYVPPFLIMCSGVTVAIDCTSATGDVVDIGELSKNSPNSATTQFSVATNSFNGYSSIIVGSTMTAGNRTIPPLAVPGISQPGVSQFGINLRQNSIPAVGANVEGVGTGVPNGNYNTPNSFRFQSGDTIASSSLSTEWNRYTISYLVNVADSQPAGRYASTLTVIVTTTF